MVRKHFPLRLSDGEAELVEILSKVLNVNRSEAIRLCVDFTFAFTYPSITLRDIVDEQFHGKIDNELLDKNICDVMNPIPSILKKIKRSNKTMSHAKL